MKLQRGARLNEFTEQRGAKVLRHVLVTKALPVPPASLHSYRSLHNTSDILLIYLFVLFATTEFLAFL